MGYLTFFQYWANGYGWRTDGYEYVMMWGTLAFAIALRGGGPYSVDACSAASCERFRRPSPLMARNHGALVRAGARGYIALRAPRPPFGRRGGRVVECTALEMRHTGNRIGGSNPSLSASITT
jgi:hypothetical protein